MISVFFSLSTSYAVLAALIWFVYEKYTWKRTVEKELMKWSRRILRKRQKFLVLNDKWLLLCLLTFILTRYNFDQVRCFLFSAFSIDFMVKWDTPGKFLNNKFLVFTNIYVCAWFFIRVTFLENMVLLPRYLPAIW